MNAPISDTNANQTPGTLQQPEERSGVEQIPTTTKKEEEKKKDARSLSAASALALALAGTLAPPAAWAEEEKAAIAARSELSEFNALLDRTNGEAMLNEGTYTVFAPVNEGFAALPAEKYPYLYRDSRYPQTREWTTNLAKNHIARGEIHLDNVTGGGIFASNGRFLSVVESPRGTFYVDGHKVLSMNMLGGGILYEIDGVIAKPWEVVEVVRDPAQTSANTTILVPEDSQVVVEDETEFGTHTTTIMPSR